MYVGGGSQRKGREERRDDRILVVGCGSLQL